MIPQNLPIPSAEALTHSQRLFKHILGKIHANQGKISFSEYMDLALYAPGLGYYNAGAEKFGSKGDFVTAPLISSLFSKCLARQCHQILEVLGEGDILEIGAGNGQMAVDILLELESLNCLPKHYYILELSADLKKRQQEKIASLCPDLLSRVKWLETLPNPDFSGIILANEVLDAMPVCLFRIDKAGIQELEVIQKENTLSFQTAFTKKSALLELHQSEQLSIGYTSEINLNLKPWIKSLSGILKSGVVLLIDYGFPRKEYYHPDRSMGTLMCHYQHYAHSDPFLYPGLQDITAHVDFTSIAEAAVNANLDVLGYTNQAAFLLGCGLIEIHSRFRGDDTNPQTVIQNQAINTLTSPSEMGELFKVIALGKNFDESQLLGFSLSDKRQTL